jgi:SNF2 family DNA or RNA helicase
LISLKAGGVGLNLTAADYVFILDPWWNPASEMQALSRAHRIGQDKNVFVYRYITSESIEEKISRLQEKKSKLAETFISSNNPLKEIDIEEILNIIS